MDDFKRLIETWDFVYKVKSLEFSDQFLRILKISKDLYEHNDYKNVLIIDNNFHYFEHAIFDQYSENNSNVTVITLDEDMLNETKFISSIDDLKSENYFDLIIYNPYQPSNQQIHPYLDENIITSSDLENNFNKNFNILFNNHLNDNGKIILYDEEGSISSLNWCPEYDKANDFEAEFKINFYKYLETVITGIDNNSNILIFNNKSVKRYFIFQNKELYLDFDVFEMSQNITDKEKQNWIKKSNFNDPEKTWFARDLIKPNYQITKLLNQDYFDVNKLKFFLPKNIEDCKYFLRNNNYKDPLIVNYPNVNNNIEIIELTSKIISGKSKNKDEYQVLIKHHMEFLYLDELNTNEKLKWNFFNNWDHNEGKHSNQFESSLFIISVFGPYNHALCREEEFKFLKHDILTINKNFRFNKNKDFILFDNRNLFNHNNEIDPSIIQDRLERLIEILNSDGDIFVQVTSEVLKNSEFEEFRDTFSSCLKTIIKLEKGVFLLHFTNYSELYSIYDISKDNNTKISLGILNKKDKIIKSKDFYKSWVQIKNLDEFEKKQITNIDLNNLIKKGQKDNEKGQKKIISNISDIKTILIEDLMPRVEILKNGMDGIEKTIENIENNAEKINRESEIAIQTCNNNETSEYEKEKKLAQKKYPEIWNLLNEESKDYIAGAELLFNLIHKSELKEFSSFILYYSKALENEISEKIFKKFIEKLISKKVDFENIFKITPPNKNFGKGRLTKIEKNISHFKNEVFKIINKKNSNTKELKITIGAMDHILKKVINTESDSYKFIKIIRELNIFLNESIINYNSKKLNEIIEKRNGAAHTEKFDYKEAIRFHSLISLFLKDFYKKTSKRGNQNVEKKVTLKILIPAKLVEEFKKIHGDKYDYSKAESFSGSYHRIKNTKIKLAIVCKIHGEFLMTPGAHLNGSGCLMCILKQ